MEYLYRDFREFLEKNDIESPIEIQKFLHRTIKDVKNEIEIAALDFKNCKIECIHPWYHFDFTRREISFQSAREEFDSLLEKAVNDRLISDVPLGVFLSGGLDSSTVAWYAAKNSSAKIKTFSVGFDEKSYDESDYARKVATHLGSEHFEEQLSADACLKLIPEITSQLDEPFADASIIPTFLLSRFTRKEVTVALGGDGSDELLAGYPTFISGKYANLLRYLPAFAAKGIANLSRLLPVSDENISLDFKISQFLKGAGSNISKMHSLWLGSFVPEQKKLLFSAAFRETITNGDGMNIMDRLTKESRASGQFEQVLHGYYRSYLADDILFKVDRASMYNSLEVRAPFLDFRVVDFLNQLPPDYKLHGNTVKWLLKETMRGRLPADIIDRPKKGFGIPLASWLRTHLKPLSEELLHPEKILKAGIFNPQYVSRLLKEHQSGRYNHRKLLWNLLVFEMWRQQYGQIS